MNHFDPDLVRRQSSMAALVAMGTTVAGVMLAIAVIIQCL